MSRPSDAVTRTVRFESCRAVFQGGGCRGAAHAGAFEAAIDCGVTFSAVAGTSAGSIVAALIGAGAAPEYLLRTLGALDFTKLLAKPQAQDGYSSATLRALAWTLRVLPGHVPRALSRILLYGGMHSAEPLERWVNERLRELLPAAKHPVRFCDLQIPTSVVATDLARNTAKVWSSELTPDESVAFAVRCSSSLPFFFQATVQGDSRLVDGGLLSNLPAFVHKANHAPAEECFSDPVLAFRLEEVPPPPSEWTPALLLKRLADAVVDGGIDLQLKLDRNVHIVHIPTLGVRATDFDRMSPELSDGLISSGREATYEFFRNENVHWSAVAANTSVCRDEYETFLAIVQESLRPATEILISSRNSLWIWKLFPTLLRWLHNCSTIRIALPPMSANGTERRKEEHRRQTMRSLGAQVIETPTVELCAFVFRRPDPRWTSAVILENDPTEYRPHSVRYEGYVHQGVLNALIERLRQLFPREERVSTSSTPIGLREADSTVLLGLLKKGVFQYARPEVALSIEDLPIERLDLIVSKLRAYKYRQISNLVHAYQTHGLPLFTPAVLNHPSGSQSYITPPVVELHGDRFVVIEGNTRVYFCYRSGHKSIRCVVARGVTDALPGKPVHMRRVLICVGFVPPQERLQGFNYDSFRRIEGAIHQPHLSNA